MLRFVPGKLRHEPDSQYCYLRVCPGTMRKIGSQQLEGTMAKFHARPSLQYRYEHYDPQVGSK
jgi:hypothetical protein